MGGSIKKGMGGAMFGALPALFKSAGSNLTTAAMGGIAPAVAPKVKAPISTQPVNPMDPEMQAAEKRKRLLQTQVTSVFPGMGSGKTLLGQ